jgi:hypothetical protein
MLALSSQILTSYEFLSISHTKCWHAKLCKAASWRQEFKQLRHFSYDNDERDDWSSIQIDL